MGEETIPGTGKRPGEHVVLPSTNTNQRPTDMSRRLSVLLFGSQAARGMLYLHTHSPPIVHRDLKSSNLVVDEHWHVKVRAGFGGRLGGKADRARCRGPGSRAGFFSCRLVFFLFFGSLCSNVLVRTLQVHIYVYIYMYVCTAVRDCPTCARLGPRGRAEHRSLKKEGAAAT